MPQPDYNTLSPAELQALLNGPGLTPPPGVTPNLDNPPNKATLARCVIGVFLTLGSIFVLLRVYGVLFVLKKRYMSDCLMVPAYGLYLGFTILLLTQSGVGSFVHQWDYRFRDLGHLFFLFNIATNLSGVAFLLIKVMILLEWLRIFVPRGTRNASFWVSTILITINVLFYSAALVAVDLACIPYKKIWDRLTPGHCVDSKIIIVTSSAINLLIDISILILPQRIIWKLHMSSRRKLGVAAIFAVGLLGCVAAVVRMVVSIQYSHSRDETYTFFTVCVWSVVEQTCGLIIFCVPVIPKTFQGIQASITISSLMSWKSFFSRCFKVRRNWKNTLSLPRAESDAIHPSLYDRLDGDVCTPLNTLTPQEHLASHTDLPRKSLGIHQI
ncbi:hypothetical protein F5B22DRAFT_573897 [Xylaria bambusicola]|uniref:uncharacterized protein n=1 Tax=Xylaria bambusicola TaxID=326684 RepID=UPI002007482F|nr:uncharacterized protein F5B22DRAFT_573897 [Xylaria bambusicola]KAI0521453.1 hypothetical protein F5B22DRAFT_573897 [Xylaria bambusicola]